jgi:hypothetical protein
MGPTADGSRWLPPVPQMDGSDCIGIFSTDFPTSCSQSSRLFPDDGHLSSTLTLVVPQCLRHCRDIADRDSQRRGFFVFENPDFPIPNFLGSPDTRHAQWTVLIRSGNRVSRFCYARNFCFWDLRYPDSRYADRWPPCRLSLMVLDRCHASLQRTIPISSGFRDCCCPNAHDLENSDFPMVDIPMPVGTSLLLNEGLTSVRLPTDPTTVGVSSQIQWLRSVLLLCASSEA